MSEPFSESDLQDFIDGIDAPLVPEGTKMLATELLAARERIAELERTGRDDAARISVLRDEILAHARAAREANAERDTWEARASDTHDSMVEWNSRAAQLTAERDALRARLAALDADERPLRDGDYFESLGRTVYQWPQKRVDHINPAYRLIRIPIVPSAEEKPTLADIKAEPGINCQQVGYSVSEQPEPPPEAWTPKIGERVVVRCREKAVGMRVQGGHANGAEGEVCETSGTCARVRSGGELWWVANCDLAPAPEPERPRHAPQQYTLAQARTMLGLDGPIGVLPAMRWQEHQRWEAALRRIAAESDDKHARTVALGALLGDGGGR